MDRVGRVDGYLCCCFWHNILKDAFCRDVFVLIWTCTFCSFVWTFTLSHSSRKELYVMFFHRLLVCIAIGLKLGTCQKQLPCLWWWTMVVCLIGNKLPFTEFKYQYAFKTYGNFYVQKMIPNLWPLNSLLCDIRSYRVWIAELKCTCKLL